MGLISGIQAITAVQKIKQGGTAKLSIAQIAELIINLPDAQKNPQKSADFFIFSDMCLHKENARLAHASFGE